MIKEVNSRQPLLEIGFKRICHMTTSGLRNKGGLKYFDKQILVINETFIANKEHNCLHQGWNYVNNMHYIDLDK